MAPNSVSNDIDLVIDEFVHKSLILIVAIHSLDEVERLLCPDPRLLPKSIEGLYFSGRAVGNFNWRISPPCGLSVGQEARGTQVVIGCDG